MITNEGVQSLILVSIMLNLYSIVEVIFSHFHVARISDFNNTSNLTYSCSSSY